MKKVYKLRFSKYLDSSPVVVHGLVNVCASSDIDAVSSLIKSHSDSRDLISVEILEIIDFVNID